MLALAGTRSIDRLILLPRSYYNFDNLAGVECFECEGICVCPRCLRKCSKEHLEYSCPLEAAGQQGKYALQLLAPAIGRLIGPDLAEASADGIPTDKL